MTFNPANHPPIPARPGTGTPSWMLPLRDENPTMDAARKAQAQQAATDNNTSLEERSRLRALWAERAKEKQSGTWGFICTECEFSTNHGYPGFAMDEVRTHSIKNNHLVVLGLDIGNHPITKQQENKR